jgi:predicted nucleic acid-binding protein
VIIQLLAAHQPTVMAMRRLVYDRLAVSLVTVGEVYDGAFRFSNPREHLLTYRMLFRSFEIVNLSDGIMERFAELRFNLRRTGQMIPDFDLVLCATAIEHDLTLLTYNLRHMRRVPNLRVHSPH